MKPFWWRLLRCCTCNEMLSMKVLAMEFFRMTALEMLLLEDAGEENAFCSSGTEGLLIPLFPDIKL